MTLVESVARYFQAHPGEWIDGKVIAEIGGGYGWRTRISDARRRYALTIENRVRHVTDHEPSCPAMLAWDIPGACQCGRSRVYVVSEYRYVPAVPETTGSDPYDANTWGLRG